MSEPKPKYMTARQIGAHFQMARSTVVHLANDGRIPRLFINHRNHRYVLEDVEAAMRKFSQQASGAARVAS